MTASPPSPLVIGLPGPDLSPDQRAAIADIRPVGLILFARNHESQDQVRRLVETFRTLVDLPEAVVMIDQEGGRVQQFRGHGWPDFPSFGRLGRLATDVGLDAARAAAREMSQAIGSGLKAHGIDTVCSPVIDLNQPEGHDVIGHRAFGADPHIVTQMGQAVCDGFLSVGVTPILKHMPGHGRAPVDSHQATPMVHTDLATLDQTDFKPFKALNTQPWAMVAHVVYPAVDGERPASVSPTVVDQVIRHRIGYNGILISDCLYMKALSGSVPERCAASLNAGLDLALACFGDHKDWRAFARATGPIRPDSWVRLQADHQHRHTHPITGPMDVDIKAVSETLQADLPVV